MELPILIGVAAFIILAVMFALLWASSRREERDDTVTQEIIIKANTGPVIVSAPVTTQEDED